MKSNPPPEAALKILSTLTAKDDPELAVDLKNITAQAHLGLYYAEKIRGATSLAADKEDEAKTAMGKAVGHWQNYVTIMDSMFHGADMMRSKDFKDWHVHDAAVLKEFTRLGGRPEDLNPPKNKNNKPSARNELGGSKIKLYPCSLRRNTRLLPSDSPALYL